jgi:hypothetical protein
MARTPADRGNRGDLGQRCDQPVVPGVFGVHGEHQNRHERRQLGSSRRQRLPESAHGRGLRDFDYDVGFSDALTGERE